MEIQTHAKGLTDELIQHKRQSTGNSAAIALDTKSVENAVTIVHRKTECRGQPPVDTERVDIEFASVEFCITEICPRVTGC